MCVCVCVCVCMCVCVCVCVCNRCNLKSKFEIIFFIYIAWLSMPLLLSNILQSFYLVDF